MSPLNSNKNSDESDKHRQIERSVKREDHFPVAGHLIYVLLLQSPRKDTIAYHELDYLDLRNVGLPPWCDST